MQGLLSVSERGEVRLTDKPHVRQHWLRLKRPTVDVHESPFVVDRFDIVYICL